MSLYVHAENQTLLWNTIQKMPEFHRAPIQKEQWFSNIIRHFYQQHQHQQLTPADLQILNRQTIAYMVEDLHAYASTPRAQPKIMDAFASRQYEYESQTKPKEPPVANFGEKIDDEAITNMDELIQQQIKQREYDVAKAKENMPVPPSQIILPSNTDRGSTDQIIKDLQKQMEEFTKKVETLFAKMDEFEKKYETMKSI